MFGLLNGFTKKVRDIFVDQNDVLLVLEVINNLNQKSALDVITNMSVTHCGGDDELTKWIIMFDATDKNWRAFIKGLYEADRGVVLDEDCNFYVT